MGPYDYYAPNQYQQYNGMNQYDSINQLRNQLNQNPYQNQQNMYQNQQMMRPAGLNGEIVDGIEVVKAKNVDMSGNVTFYPKSDMTEIYTKQLQPDGTSKIVIYRAVMPEENAENEQQMISVDAVGGLMAQMKTELLEEMKALFPKATTSRSRKGGASE